jgi:hypothetical protein
MTRKWLAGLTLLLVAATISGCSGADPAPLASPGPAEATTTSATPSATPTLSTPTATPAPAFAVATYDSSTTDGGMKALLQGTGVVRNGCFYLRPDDVEPEGPDVVLPVFPDQRIRIEGSQTYFNEKLLREGERIDLGGGFARSSQATDRPSGCRGQRTVFLVGDY